MARAAVNQLVYMLDEAFEGVAGPRESMLGNLASVTEEDWLWVPPHGARTIRRIIGHVGGAAYLYYDRAFGGHADFGEPINWNIPAGNLGHGTLELAGSPHLDPEPPMADVVAWATERARIFWGAVAALDDDDQLREERLNHHRQHRPISWFAAVMAQHYSYHAGEINHIRALHQGNDG